MSLAHPKQNLNLRLQLIKKLLLQDFLGSKGWNPTSYIKPPPLMVVRGFSTYRLIWEFCTWWCIYIIIPARGELYPSNFLTTGLYQFHQLGVDFRYPPSFVCRGTELLIPILCPSCGSSKELILLLYPTLPSNPTMANHTIGQYYRSHSKTRNILTWMKQNKLKWSDGLHKAVLRQFLRHFR